MSSFHESKQIFLARKTKASSCLSRSTTAKDSWTWIIRRKTSKDTAFSKWEPSWSNKNSKTLPPRMPQIRRPLSWVICGIRSANLKKPVAPKDTSSRIRAIGSTWRARKSTVIKPNVTRSSKTVKMRTRVTHFCLKLSANWSVKKIAKGSVQVNWTLIWVQVTPNLSGARENLAVSGASLTPSGEATSSCSKPATVSNKNCTPCKTMPTFWPSKTTICKRSSTSLFWQMILSKMDWIVKIVSWPWNRALLTPLFKVSSIWTVLDRQEEVFHPSAKPMKIECHLTRTDLWATPHPPTKLHQRCKVPIWATIDRVISLPIKLRNARLRRNLHGSIFMPALELAPKTIAPATDLL